MAEENIQTNAPEQDLSEILKVRREKLAALRAEGRDPFKETRFDVTHHAQDIKDNFDALEGSESLSAFLEESIRANIERRKARRAFIERGLASRDRAAQTGRYIPAAEVATTEEARTLQLARHV